MAWQGSGRTDTAAHRRRRARVLKRDGYICYICGLPGADQADHVIPIAEGGLDDESNMRAIHDDPCHRRKSSAEGNRARARKRKRPPARHPGVIDQ